MFNSRFWKLKSLWNNFFKLFNSWQTFGKNHFSNCQNFLKRILLKFIKSKEKNKNKIRKKKLLNGFGPPSSFRDYLTIEFHTSPGQIQKAKPKCDFFFETNKFWIFFFLQSDIESWWNEKEKNWFYSQRFFWKLNYREKLCKIQRKIRLERFSFFFVLKENFEKNYFKKFLKEKPAFLIWCLQLPPQKKNLYS